MSDQQGKVIYFYDPITGSKRSVYTTTPEQTRKLYEKEGAIILAELTVQQDLDIRAGKAELKIVSNGKEYTPPIAMKITPTSDGKVEILTAQAEHIIQKEGVFKPEVVVEMKTPSGGTIISKPSETGGRVYTAINPEGAGISTTSFEEAKKFAETKTKTEPEKTATTSFTTTRFQYNTGVATTTTKKEETETKISPTGLVSKDIPLQLTQSITEKDIERELNKLTKKEEDYISFSTEEIQHLIQKASAEAINIKSKSPVPYGGLVSKDIPLKLTSTATYEDIKKENIPPSEITAKSAKEAEKKFKEAEKKFILLKEKEKEEEVLKTFKGLPYYEQIYAKVGTALFTAEGFPFLATYITGEGEEKREEIVAKSISRIKEQEIHKSLFENILKSPAGVGSVSLLGGALVGATASTATGSKILSSTAVKIGLGGLFTYSTAKTAVETYELYKQGQETEAVANVLAYGTGVASFIIGFKTAYKPVIKYETELDYGRYKSKQQVHFISIEGKTLHMSGKELEKSIPLKVKIETKKPVTIEPPTGVKTRIKFERTHASKDLTKTTKKTIEATTIRTGTDIVEEFKPAVKKVKFGKGLKGLKENEAILSEQVVGVALYVGEPKTDFVIKVMRGTPKKSGPGVLQFLQQAYKEDLLKSTPKIISQKTIQEKPSVFPPITPSVQKPSTVSEKETKTTSQPIPTPKIEEKLPEITQSNLLTQTKPLPKQLPQTESQTATLLKPETTITTTTTPLSRTAQITTLTPLITVREIQTQEIQQRQNITQATKLRHRLDLEQKQKLEQEPKIEQKPKTKITKITTTHRPLLPPAKLPPSGPVIKPPALPPIPKLSRETRKTAKEATVLKKDAEKLIKRKYERLLPTPIRAEISKIMFGKATPPKPTQALWKRATISVPTAEELAFLKRKRR